MVNEHHGGRAWQSWFVALLPLALTIYFALQLPVVAENPLNIVLTWVPSLGIDFAFYLDGLSVIYALLICGIGTFVIIYGGYYLAEDAHVARFYVLLLLFMVSMLGLVLADNLILLFAFWEMTSITSYLLIGYKSQSEEARAAALRALIVTGAGGMALMAGVILLGVVGETWQISSLASIHEQIINHPLYGSILALIFLGAFTKSAQVPFHFWLPGAMEAPTPVSAYLHSATMVKAGVYLLARLNPALGGTTAWTTVLLVVGGVTMLVGAFLALKQHDLKRILAFSTISSLGTLVFFIGMGSKVALEAALLFLIVHSLYKGALFMVAGAVDHAVGTRDIRQLSGLRSAMPITLVGAALAGLSMAGIPPMLGFISKELQYEASLDAPFAFGLTLIAVLTNICMVAIVGMVVFKPFFGAKSEAVDHAHEAPIGMWAGVVLMGIAALAAALLADPFGALFVAPAASAVYGSTVELHLHLIPTAITPYLVLSIITIASGVGLFSVYRQFQARTQLFDHDTISPTVQFDRLIRTLPEFARAVTRVVQSGYLRVYVYTVVLSILLLTTFTLVTRNGWRDIPLTGLDVLIHEAVLVIMIIVATVIVITTSSRLAAVASLGVIGYGIAVIFLLFSAPDLAMTQIVIETLSVILFVLVISRLPKYGQFSTISTRRRDVVFAACVGVMMTALVLLVTREPLDTHVADFYAANSYLQAQGRNVVNVILVDFRGIDTMGEISVLAIGALGVYALLKLKQPSTPPPPTSVSGGNEETQGLL